MRRLIDRHGMRLPNETHIECHGTRWHAGHVAALAALLLGVSMGAALADEEPAAKDLGVFYGQKCAGCHGADGSAAGAEGKKLRGRDLTDADWLRDTKDKKMVKVILKGIFFGLAMPGYKDELTEDEAQQMVTNIIRKGKKGKVIAPAVKEPGDEQPGSTP